MNLPACCYKLIQIVMVSSGALSPADLTDSQTPVIYVKMCWCLLWRREKTCKSLFLAFEKLNQAAAKLLAVY